MASVRRTRQQPWTTPMTSMAELNVTPLLDLAFVLLVIFMITAPFLTESADLVVPTSKASRDAVDPAKVKFVSVNQGRELFFQDQLVDFDTLRKLLAGLHQQDEETSLVIRAHETLTVADLVAVMDVAKNAGITRVGVVTKAEQAPP